MKKIVIVEDEKAIADAEKSILEDGYDVYVCYDGKIGLKKINEIKPDLAILDVMLPSLDGFALCRKIKSDSALRHLKVLMVTAKNEEKDEARGIGIGADDYIMKPFEAVELRHVVAQLLSGKSGKD